MFEDKSVIVTGSASGIGKATAELFASYGAKVVIADINSTGGEDVSHHITESGGHSIFVHTDVSELESLENMVDVCSKTFGGPDILCNNAADLSLIPMDDDLLNSDVDTWEKTFRADQLSVMLACKLAMPKMLAKGSGSIVNVSSVDGISGDDTRFAYAMAKASVNMLTQMIATRYGKQGIRCNAVAPGLVLSPMARSHMTEEVKQAFAANSLVPGFGAEPEEIASVIVFLAGAGASFINGEVIRVDGGLLSHVTHLADMRRIPGGPKIERA